MPPVPVQHAAPAVVRASSLDRDPLKLDFRNFVHKCWRTWFQTDPAPIIYDFATRFQHGPSKDIIMGFRGMAKSYTTVAGCAWIHHVDPKALVLALASTGDSSGGNADLYWGMLNNFDWLAHLKPGRDMRHSATAFDVQGSMTEKSESFAAMSLFSGNKTGRRCDVAIPDDIETSNTSSTETERAQLRKDWSEVAAALMRYDRGWGWVRMLGTPQTEDTIYTDLAQNKGYGMRIYPVVYPSPDEMKHYGPWLDPKIKKAVEANPALVHTSTMPTRFPENIIQAKRLEWGETEYKRQFLLWIDVGSSEVKPLKLRDCMVVNIPPPSPQAPLKVPSEMRWEPNPSNAVKDLQVDALTGDSTVYYPADTREYREYWQPPESLILQVDPSGTGKDETAWTVMAQHVGRVFVLEIEAALEGFTEATLNAIAASAKRWRVQRIRIEKNLGAGMFSALLRPALAKVNHPCAIEEEWATGTKELRIVDSLETLVSTHRLVLNEAMLRKDYEVHYATVEDVRQKFYRFTYQFTRIVRQARALPHDDRLDAVAAGAASFMSMLTRQLEEAARESREMDLNREVDALLAQQRAERTAMGPLQVGYEALRAGGIVKGNSLRESPAFASRVGPHRR